MMVEASARILKRFYLMQRELVLMQAGCLPGTDHWQSKLLLPECLWQDALVADTFRRRVLELRFPRREIGVGDDAPILQTRAAVPQCARRSGLDRGFAPGPQA